MTKEDYRNELETAVALRTIPLNPAKPDGLQLRPMGIAEQFAHAAWRDSLGVKDLNHEQVEEANARIFIATVVTPAGDPVYTLEDLSTVRRFDPSFLSRTMNRLNEVSWLVESSMGKDSTQN